MYCKGTDICLLICLGKIGRENCFLETDSVKVKSDSVFCVGKKLCQSKKERKKHINVWRMLPHNQMAPNGLSFVKVLMRFYFGRIYWNDVYGPSCGIHKRVILGKCCNLCLKIFFFFSSFEKVTATFSRMAFTQHGVHTAEKKRPSVLYLIAL